MEANGLLWFYNYKLRSVKIAASMFRQNPLYALLATILPTPPFLPGVGTPFSDNFFTKGLEGALPGSIGPGMLLHVPTMNPIGAMIF